MKLLNISSGRESYGDSAIGYVQVKRQNDACIVRGRVCPEHRVRVKPYSVICTVDEKENKIEEIRCLDCVASAGGCKHSIAFLMWLHRRSEEAAPTSVSCYWIKPVLSRVGSNIKFVKAVDIGRKVKIPVLNITKCDNFVHDVFEMVKSQKYVCPLSVHTSLITGAKTLSLHIIFMDFVSSNLQHTADNFIDFCCDVLTEENIANACSLSHSQSEESLWHELRFARVTASKLYDAAVCKSSSSALVNQVMGVTKLFQTAAMKRGITLEKAIVH
ncbi:hypothetical protein NQ314_019117 [Rhamnusium bicolor]|uniref:SWIM-type domain-containing protein n=1 Tax=Rhamnusium bicolor TaxID=1586634 RepID=A0AAV8WPE4_9CUCU|nr:hypothetical protein NQ314_019117 [Rhamnusium bicolor]